MEHWKGRSERGRGRGSNSFGKGRRLKAAEGSEMNGGVLKHPGIGEASDCVMAEQGEAEATSRKSLNLLSPESFFFFSSNFCIFFFRGPVFEAGVAKWGDGTLEGTIRREEERWKQFFWEGRRLKAEEGSEMNGGVLKHPGRGEAFDCVVIACLYHCYLIQYLSLNFRRSEFEFSLKFNTM
ncbi:hypothetical protein CDAR_63341 [Caerostris darwini]|uniref:Uncharacterized protein n=1 Tax=Caerostris darwini TaxID=1538125 RepID=A0AAV4QPR5_9ARAC|nr:hypothetical protein CDAR_63341 [Caerostris darwini]